jgi:general secretion pathway protein B
MSFILDALRKSEHERQRQTGPALVEVAVAAPRQKTNRWATAAIALLLVNLVAIGVLLLVKSQDEPTAAAPAAEAPATATPAAPTGAAPARVAAPAAQASVTQTLPEQQDTAPPPTLRPAEAPPVAGTRNPLEQEMSAYSPAMEYEAAAAAAAPPPGPAAVTPARRGGSVVYQSVPDAEPASTYHPPPGGSTGHLPQADEMTARGTVPELRLELHVWSTKPQERFVFVNGRRYREGETTAEGAAVEEITPDGVIMNSGGNRFLLSRD